MPCPLDRKHNLYSAILEPLGDLSLRFRLVHSRRGKRRTMRQAVIKDPEILGGEPVFRGTRVPFKILTDYLEGGATLDQFLEQYPSVSRELAVAAIAQMQYFN